MSDNEWHNLQKAHGVDSDGDSEGEDEGKSRCQTDPDGTFQFTSTTENWTAVRKSPSPVSLRADDSVEGLS